MGDKNFFYTLKQPYLIKTLAEKSAIPKSNFGLMITVIEGNRCRIWYDVFQEFFRKLKFPYPSDLKDFWKTFLDCLIDLLRLQSKKYKGILIDIANAENFLKFQEEDFKNFSAMIEQIGEKLKSPFHVRLIYRMDPADPVKSKYPLSYITSYWDVDDVPVMVTPDGKGHVAITAHDRETPYDPLYYTNQKPKHYLLMPEDRYRISKEQFEDLVAALHAKKQIAAMQNEENPTPQDQRRIKRLNQVIINYEKRRKKNYYDQFIL